MEFFKSNFYRSGYVFNIFDMFYEFTLNIVINLEGKNIVLVNKESLVMVHQ
jgi:hypothetical protein